MGDFWVTRLVFQRALALVYLLAFVAAINQFRPLLGEHGLEPVPRFVQLVPFRRAPSLFYLAPRDWAFAAAAWLGAALSTAALLGLSERAGVWLSASVWGALYVLYLSFVNVGQTFYGFGWESILLEAGFYAIFLGPASVAPPKLVIWLYRWLLFRVMFGAGLIKLRGDPCWRDLTCLDYYFETQPIPNPLSWAFHWAPRWTHQAGVLFNHLAELILPWGYFAPGAAAAWCGALTILFQASIMVSGNLSFLNLLTIVIAIPCLNDRWLSWLPVGAPAALAAPAPFTWAVYGLAALVGALSLGPIANLASAGQMMNFSYNPFHLVGTYGAFGSITRRRYEISLEGTDEAVVLPSTRWREYGFKGKPGDPLRRPPQIAPYHLRLDWLMWFAAMGSPDEHPWLPLFMRRLLQGDAASAALLRDDPFRGGPPPRFVRARLYLYRFTAPEERRRTGAWWTRELAGEYLPPLSLSSTRMLEPAGADR